MTEYTHRYSITAADMDTHYRMVPGAALLYYQDCWARYMSCLHLAAFDVVKRNLMWVITEFNAWFEAEPALWSDEIDVTVWNSEISAMKLYADFRIHKNDGREVAHGYGCWTLLDTEAHRLTPNTELAPQIPVLPEMTAATHRKQAFSTEGTALQTFEHRVNPINLDFNGHVNNRTYLSIAMQSANEQFMRTHAIRSLTIRWQKETFLGDTLQCTLVEFPGDKDGSVCHYLHTIRRNGEQVAAQVYSEWEPQSVHSDVSEKAQRV